MLIILKKNKTGQARKSPSLSYFFKFSLLIFTGKLPIDSDTQAHFSKKTCLQKT